MKINYYANSNGKFGKLLVSGDPIEPIALGENLKAATEALVRGIKVLSDLPIKHYVSAGTALGIVRDNGYIPHDTDLDIEIITSYKNPVDLGMIHSAMSSNGFRLIRTVFDVDKNNKEQYPKQLAYITSENVVFDLWFVYTDVDEGFAVTYSEYGKMKTPIDMITNIKSKKYIVEGEELDLILPNQLEDYCEMRYGSDWRIPKTYKGPWQQDAGNLE